MKEDASPEEALASRWVVVEAGGSIGGYRVEDMSIATVEGKEVIGCSEWMRADRRVFDHIVEIHNASLPNSKDKPRDEQQSEVPATQICHWPSQDVPCCDAHAEKMKKVAAAIRLRLSFTPANEGVDCVNCIEDRRDGGT